jgi:hypothetical protein
VADRSWGFESLRPHGRFVTYAWRVQLPADLASLERQASVAQVGGFRPPDEPATSWMGTVKLGAEGEDWPAADGEPMHGVLQLLTRDLPSRPAALEGIEMLALFVAEDLPLETPNGVGWCLRTYDSLDGLRLLDRPTDFDPALKPFPLLFSEVGDWPGHDNVPFELMERWREHTDADEARYAPHMGLKVGGWPCCVQSEVDWFEDGEAIPDVEFVLQVDSDDKVGFVVADAGVFYIGRRAGTGTWHAAWQSA